MRFIFLVLLLLGSSVHAREYGARSAPPERYGSVPEAYAPLLGTSLPNRVDLSGNMPPPGKQINQSCVGWATAYGLKSYQEKVERKWSLTNNSGGLVTDHVFSPSFVYNQINGGQDLGSYFADAFHVLATQGAAPLSVMPYRGMPFERVTQSAQAAASPYKIDTYRRLERLDTNELKTQLAADFPIVFSARVFGQFENLGRNEIWSRATGPVLGNHAMLIVGYDDQRQAFKVMNSWGREWGSDGYGWISYDLFPVVANEAYIVVDLKGTEAKVVENDDRWTPPAIDAEQSTITVTNLNPNYVDPFLGVGMYISGEFSVPAGVRGTVQIVLPLTFANGVPVSTSDPMFRLPSGQAATGTPKAPLNGLGVNRMPWYAFILYCSLDLPKTKLCIPFPSPPQIAPAQSDLMMQPVLFIDNFGVAQGQPFNFFVRL